MQGLVVSVDGRLERVDADVKEGELMAQALELATAIPGRWDCTICGGRRDTLTTLEDRMRTDQTPMWSRNLAVFAGIVDDVRRLEIMRELGVTVNYLASGDVPSDMVFVFKCEDRALALTLLSQLAVFAVQGPAFVGFQTRASGLVALEVAPGPAVVSRHVVPGPSSNRG